MTDRAVKLLGKRRSGALRRDHFTFFQLIMIVLAWSLIAYCLDLWVSQRLRWYERSVISMGIIGALLAAKRPELLNGFLQIQRRKLGLGLSVGVLLGTATVALVGPDRLNRPSALLWIVLIGPPLEEFLMRGVLLRSLRPQLGPIISVLAVSCFSAFVHFYFWPEVAVQAGFCILYLASEGSLTSTTLAHVIANLIGSYPALRWWN